MKNKPPKNLLYFLLVHKDSLVLFLTAVLLDALHWFLVFRKREEFAVVITGGALIETEVVHIPAESDGDQGDGSEL